MVYSGQYNNCLNLFRLIASIQVMVGHMVHHLSLSVPKFIVWPLNIFYGVPIFFLLSGFLIWNSIDRSSDWKVYFNKRILRLYPELWVCLFFEILSIVVFYNEKVSIVDFSVFTICQGSVFQFYTPDVFRNYGCGTPNGSLWTITVIVQFYLFIFFIKKYLKRLSFKGWTVILISSIIIGLLLPFIKPQFPEIVGKLLSQTLIPYFWLFFIGVYIQNFRESIINFITGYWSCFLIINILIYIVGIDLYATYPVFRCISLACFMFGFAFKYPQLNIKLDVSYGIYIYHMIFVNIAIQLGFTGNWAIAGCVLISTCIFAYLSTTVVGGFSKKQKEKITRVKTL